ncbi:MAG TPA: DUF3667 domain-containing protein [Longimicrobiaceae bacterium]|jgi:hypothetical protein|nr:DUF3667 domain-containing protein [Longimicrobiaceae bacterium]
MDIPFSDPLAARPTAVGPSPAVVVAAGEACASCGATLGGRFCEACGEERLGAHHYSLRRFLADAVKGVTDLDGNAARTFAALLTRPGLLTVEYLAGRRRAYLPPLRVFLLCNVLFFLLVGYLHVSMLTTPLDVHLHYLPYSGLARRMVARAVAAKGMPFASYEALFNGTLANEAKTLVIVLVPLFALLMQLVYVRSRRFFVEHLVFSLHFFAIFLLLIPTMMLVIALGVLAGRAAGADLRWLVTDKPATLLFATLEALYLFPALLRVYGEGRGATAGKCLLLVLGTLGAVQAYRFILFFTTYYTI